MTSRSKLYDYYWSLSNRHYSEACDAYSRARNASQKAVCCESSLNPLFLADERREYREADRLLALANRYAETAEEMLTLQDHAFEK